MAVVTQEEPTNNERELATISAEGSTSIWKKLSIACFSGWLMQAPLLIIPEEQTGNFYNLEILQQRRFLNLPYTKAYNVTVQNKQSGNIDSDDICIRS